MWRYMFAVPSNIKDLENVYFEKEENILVVVQLCLTLWSHINLRGFAVVIYYISNVAQNDIFGGSDAQVYFFSVIRAL